MSTSRRSEFTELMAQAQRAFDELRVAQALEYYRAAEELQPEDAGVHAGVARCLMRLRRTQDALAEAQRAVELDPEHWEGWDILGTLHWLTDRHDEAIASLQRAITLAPQAPEPRLALAQNYTDMRRFTEAQETLEEARAIIAGIQDPTERRRQEAFAWHVETYWWLAQRRDTEARQAAEQAIERQDANPYAASLAYSNVGITHARARRYATAIEYLDQALALNAYLPQVKEALGRLLLINRRYDRAAEVLREALDAGIGDIGTLHHAYGLALAKLGRREEAREQYQLALKEGLPGAGNLVARWQMLWLYDWARYAVAAVVLAAIVLWITLGNPSPAALTFLGVLVVVLGLQWFFGRRRQ